ncbi:MAG: DegQ family serine endoprotease [Candidatus Krumholzibacteriota bacterium]|nr:DegQ family serine endoprotease [Candidatus Krumholzibacteriota bacterium]
MSHHSRKAKAAAFAGLLLLVLLAGGGLERVLTTAGPGASGSALMAATAAEETLPDVVERVVPAVVNIYSKKVVKTRQETPWFFEHPFFRDFFGNQQRGRAVPRERIEQNLGSGVIVSADGYILTNNHLVETADEVRVVLPDEREYEAEIVGSDPRSDVAVLKIDEKDLPTVPIGSATDLRLAETVLAIGYPYGIGQTVTKGIVSALGRSAMHLVDYENFIQTDASINPGNSGGALINTRGELVGINTAIVSRSGGSQGIGLAIPIELARSVMESIIEHGHVVRGYIGVSIQEVTRQMAEAFGLDEPRGVLIGQVLDDSPAASGGIERGDIVLEYDGARVDRPADLQQRIAATEPGTKIDFVVQRDGKRKTLEVKIGEHPDSAAKTEDDAIEDYSPLMLGVGIENLDDRYRERLDIPERVDGVLVTEVDPATPAGEAGLQRGDVIMEVDRERVRGIDDFNDVLKKRDDARRLLLLVYRQGGTFYLVIR